MMPRDGGNAFAARRVPQPASYFLIALAAFLSHRR